MSYRLAKPVRLERTRTFLARIIYCYLTIPTRIALWLAPQNHPWRALTKSSFEDMREMTWATLRPRRESGEVEAVAGPPPKRRGVQLLWIVAAYVAYATAARTTELIPALLPYLAEDSIF